MRWFAAIFFHSALLWLSISATDDYCLQNADIFFKCVGPSTFPCISRSWVCDGANDCDDGSDETFCEACNDQLWFRCDIGHPCIEKEWLCDGTHDCVDGSDEKVSMCGACKSGEFHCTSGECVSNSSVCDGDRDCFDNSDEQPPYCFRPTDPPCNLTREFNCMVPSPSPAHCIPKIWVCDGESDCDSGIDEDGCIPTTAATFTVNPNQPTQVQATQEPPVIQCADNEFQCYDGVKCLQWSRRCDSIVDCHDNSDEIDCADVPHCPPKVQFSCDNTNCIRLARHCDNIDDCGDNSDEFNCGQSRPVWEECEGMYRCGSGECLTYKRVCDNKNHCKDGSDEKNCSINECLRNPCPGEQICVDEPTYYRCKCNRGYRITERGCEDVNECDTYGRCAQHCTNSAGSFSCSCNEGYTLRPDGRTCKANDGNAQLLYAHGQDVRMMNLATRTFTELAKNRLSVVPVAYHYKQEMVYFGEFQRSRIVKVPADGSAQPSVILTGIEGAREPDGLAVDWLNDWIYWASPAFRTISMAKLDGSYSRVVVDETLKLDEPRGVAVDPLRGYLFWTDWGNHSHIGSAAMDGSGQRQILVDDMVWPNGIAVDTITQRIFWVDGKLGTVEVANYFGQRRRILIQSGIGRPMFIALYEDKMYVSSEWRDNTGRLFIASKLDGSHLMTLADDVYSIQGVAIYQKQQQREGHNHCDGAGCSHECVASYLSFTDFKCLCPVGVELLNDKKTCANVVDRCEDDYCNGNGQCIVSESDKQCLCDQQHKGLKCADVKPFNIPCGSDLCNHHGQCFTSAKGPYCTCTDGYTGVRCEMDIVPTSEPTSESPVGPGESKSGGVVAIAVGGAIGGLVALGVIIIIVVIFMKDSKKKAVNFDNPVYKSDSNAVSISVKPASEEVKPTSGVNDNPSSTSV